ncbi:hypothetical protein MTO96_024204 [Rhipicephalus appendiculatus]
MSNCSAAATGVVRSATVKTAEEHSGKILLALREGVARRHLIVHNIVEQMADVLWPAEVASFLLKFATLVIVVLLGFPQTLPNSYPAVKYGPYWTLLDVAQLALLTILLWRRWRRCLPPSGFAAAILGLMSTACVLDVFQLCATATQLQDITLSAHNFERNSFIVSFFALVTVIGNFLLSEIQDLVIKKPEGHFQVLDEDTLSPLGRKACTLLMPLIKDAYFKGASASARLPPLRRGMHCKNLVRTLTAKLASRHTFHRRRSAYVIALAKVLWIDVLRAFVITAAYYGAIFSRVPALELLINSQDGVGMTSAVLLFAAATVCELMVSCYQIDVFHTFGCRIRSLLQVQIFTKVTTMSSSTKACYPTGKISSMLTVDCTMISLFTFALPILLVGVLLSPLLFWMIGTRAGLWPSVCTASGTLLVLCLPSFASSLQKRLWLIIILFSTLYALEPDKVLTPALSFSCVSLLYMTDLSMNSCGQGLRNFNQGVLALGRIADFCTADDQEDNRHDAAAHFSIRRGAVTMEKCTFAWSDDGKPEAHLLNVNLNVEPGSLIGVVGFVGSGKSSLLSAILGDMHRIEGNVTCVGSVAYAPQLPCVHNMTIRDNILYGKAMDHPFYEKVIRSCQLINDINKLQAGDMTEVGEKTRIVVCNQGHFLRHMDKLVLVDGKRVKIYDKLEDLVSDPDSPKNFREALEQRISQQSNEVGTGREDMEENDTVGRITEEEGGQVHESCQLLRSLLRLSQWPATVGVLVIAAGACAFALEQLSIKEWTDSSARMDSSGAGQLRWVRALVCLCLTDVALRIVGSILLSMSAQRLSRSLHNEMLRHVLRSPVSFFDGSPQGRIVNRFSADLDFIDTRTFLSAKQSIQNTLITAAKVAVIGTQSPVVLAATAVVTVLTGYGMNLAVKASHCARFYESVATSRLLQHACETMDALSSVRTYGVTDWFRRHFCRLADDTTRGLAGFSITYRFTRTLTSVAGFVVVMCTLLANTVFAGPDGPDPSGLGLALSSAISVPIALMTLCVMLFNVLQMIVSFERCVEYTELPPEEDVTSGPNEGVNAANGDTFLLWPSEGKVEFQNYSASYRPGVLPSVLSNVTFEVNPSEKIGVVGRTGAGKSSLVLALLRMLRASEGRILIDNVDIAGVPVKKLRRSITVIPQDPSLVRGTLRMNLDPTDSYSDQEIWACLERARLAKAPSVRKLGCSVGQRQLVCLARALLRGTKVLLLDEVTSQMDGDTDQLIQVALRDAFAQCTLFTIAHRIHTVLDYDRILVLEDGKVKEFDSVPRLLSDESSTFFNMASEAGVNAVRRDELISTYL